MKLYKPSELISYLQRLGVTAKKGFSQNFLIDQNIIQRIIKDATVVPHDVILEIGPGPGALTDALLETGATVYAVEKDALFAKGLRERNHPRLHIIEGDFLEAPFPINEPCKIVANLPYNITSPIFEKLFTHSEQITTMTVMVQKEFADRIVASKDVKEYGSFTLFVELYADVLHRFSVSPHCFFPPPKVTSSVVSLKMNKKNVAKDPNFQNAIIRHCFTKRRKMLRACLREMFSQHEIAVAFDNLPFAETLRPENLSLKDFGMLADELQAQRKQ